MSRYETIQINPVHNLVEPTSYQPVIKPPPTPQYNANHQDLVGRRVQILLSSRPMTVKWIIGRVVDANKTSLVVFRYGLERFTVFFSSICAIIRLTD